MGIRDFWDEALYTLDGVREIAQDLGYFLKNLPSSLPIKGKLRNCAGILLKICLKSLQSPHNIRLTLYGTWGCLSALLP